MSTRKPSPPTRAYQPAADALETRELLSGVVSGTDIDGDTWVLHLVGPGAISVVKQNDSSGNPAPLDSPTEINTINLGGTDPLKSHLIGTVKTGPHGDGRVFFQDLTSLPGRSEKFSGSGTGILAIQMPNFWLGNTTPSAVSTTPAPAAISLPDGVVTFQFGGVDTTHNRPAATSTSIGDVDTVRLGLPTFGGTRIIIDRSISSTQTTPAVGSTPGTTIQHGVEFDVSGRLNIFQANEIDGDGANPPGQFTNQNPNASGKGGTTVFSGTAGTQPFFTTSGFKGGVTGQIGDVRVGGNATNFMTLVNDATGGGGDKISNFSVGGETHNVMLIAPNGARNVVFGLGMDTVQINAHVINTLKANRGALNSRVIVDRTISTVNLGGDAVNTTVQSGYQQSYTAIFSNVSGITTGTPSAPPQPLGAEIGGGMLVHVAGDVKNSVFAASVQPVNNVFGAANQLVLPTGHIKGKIEGTIDNSTATPAAPKQAFYADSVQSFSGPVTPPNVPQAPYPGGQFTRPYPGLTPLGNPAHTKTTKSADHASQNQTVQATTTIGKSTPKGPHVAAKIKTQ